MNIIAGHRNPDFDCFASAVAAQKIYKDHVVVISGVPQQNLSQYLAIYEEQFNFISESDLPEKRVASLVIVDTASEKRLGKKIRALLKNAERIVVYDHHPDIKESGISGKIKIESVGATITLLLEEIRTHGIPINPVEATLFAIGLYEDTGNFLYTTTTLRDIDALKFLVERGANLVEISDYIKVDLNYDQKIVAEQLISNMETHDVNGINISMAFAETEKFIGGLNAVVSKLWYLQKVDTLVCVVRTGKKTYVVGRTSSNDIDLGSAMAELGGGGHQKAASCSLKTQDLNEAKSKVLNALKKHVNKGLKARDIMSSPVRVVYTGMSISEVNKIMERTGHNGLPVIQDNQLVGIVTKKSVDKAMNHKLGTHPIKSIMSRKLMVVSPETPISKVRQIMVENDIGRVPVVENGILVGIITRTDMMRSILTERLHSDSFPKKTVYESYGTFFADIKDLMISNLPKRILNLLRLFGQYGDEIGLPVYIVGGFVRDLLLGNPNYDLDIVVEKDGLKFAEYVSKQLDVKVVRYEKFLTSSLFFKDGLRVDVATARTEYYEMPTELPQVEVSTIRKDLYRRDFTINAMAIKLNTYDFGTLVDFFGAKRDLEKGVIRALHTLSFLEDPTRILRAVRFEQRFQFTIEEHTAELMKEAVEQGYLARVSGQRLRQEFEKILLERNPVVTIKRLADFRVLKHMFPGVFYTENLHTKLVNLFRFLPWAKQHYKEKLNIFYAVMSVLLEYVTKESLHEIASRYGLSRKFVTELMSIRKAIVPISEMISLRMRFSDIYRTTKDFSPEAMCYLASYLSVEDQEYMKAFLEKLSNTHLSEINGKTLISRYQMKPGKRIGRILEQVLCAKLDEEIRTSERSYVEKLIKQWNSSSEALER